MLDRFSSDIIRDYRSSMAANELREEPVIDSEDTTFNAAEFFFTSYHIATKYPQLKVGEYVSL